MTIKELENEIAETKKNMLESNEIDEIVEFDEKLKELYNKLDEEKNKELLQQLKNT